MQIVERSVGDIDRLTELVAMEKHADRRDRYRIALLALRGREKLEIAEVLGVAKSTVEQWAYAYRDGGIAALAGKKRGGSSPKIAGDKSLRLRARLDAGPTEGDKVCTLRGKDVQRIAKDELGVDISLNGVYRTLRRLGYSCLAPRPRHEKQDLEAQKKFKDETAPLL
ncbi:MAG TPA: winged helix-turn-helix domain-containing protein [Phycisphaerales bacterium]|nr:winged helix-turn-helix domain-containing protein [Phycisphaerales bacterium]